MQKRLALLAIWVLMMGISVGRAESFSALFGDVSKELSEAFKESSGVIDEAIKESAKELESLFDDSSEETADETEAKEDEQKDKGSFLNDIGTIWGGIAKEEIGIPKTIHYGDYEAFKKDIDLIEAYFEEYAEFMKNYDANDLSMIADYTSFLASYVEAMQVLDALDESKMSSQEKNYYNKVLLRINKVLYNAL